MSVVSAALRVHCVLRALDAHAPRPLTSPAFLRVAHNMTPCFTFCTNITCRYEYMREYAGAVANVRAKIMDVDIDTPP